MAMTERKVIDCQKVGQVSDCTLSIAGTEQEVMETAVLHAIHHHGHQDTPELRDMIRRHMATVPMPKAG